MTRRRRRASSAPQTVGSEDGLTSSRPQAVTPEDRADDGRVQGPVAGAEPQQRSSAADEGAGSRQGVKPPGGAEQTKDDTDEGWGDPGDDEASARWLKENRPPHWS